MRRALLPILLVSIAFIALGCRKPDDPRPRADLALGGLMPAGDPGFDVSYVVDQKKVKTLPMREIPEGSLLEIAANPQSRMEETDMAPARAPRAAMEPPGNSEGGSFWGQLGQKTLGSVLWGNGAARAAAADDGDEDDTNYEEEDTEEEAED